MPKRRNKNTALAAEVLFFRFASAFIDTHDDDLDFFSAISKTEHRKLEIAMERYMLIHLGYESPKPVLEAAGGGFLTETQND